MTTSDRRRAPAQDDRGLTLIEVLLASVIAALIITALTGAFITSLRTTDGLSDANARTADIQLVSTFFPTDAQSVAGEKNDNPTTNTVDEHVPPGFSTPPPQGPVCQTPTTSVGVWTFYRDFDATTDRFRKAVTYSAEGTGETSQLKRYECDNGVVRTTSTVAEHFGPTGTNDPAAAFVGIVCRGTSGTPGQPAHTCRLQIRGAYDYDLTVDRRSRGLEATSTRPPGLMRAPDGVPGNQRVSVSWDPPVDDGGSDILGYEIRSNPPGTSQTFDASVTSRDYTGLTNGVNYRFSIRARNQFGWGPWSADSPLLKPGPTAPAAPTIGTATPLNQGASVTFAPPADDGGASIDLYEVIAQDTVSGNTFSNYVGGSPGRVGKGVTNIQSEWLQNGSTYVLTVRAHNAFGWGPFSAESNPVVPTTTVPDPPTDVTAAATQTRRTARVTWVKPVDDGGADIETYNIFASTGESVVGVLATPTTAYDVPDLPAGVPITFTVTAVNANGESLPSAPSAPLLLKDVPGKITPRPVLTVGAGEGQAHLEWSLPPENGAPIQSYDIERQCTPAIVCTADENGAAYAPGSVTGIVTAARQWDLANQPKSPAVVQYRVRARNSEGLAATASWSDWSNPLTLGGPASPPEPITVTWNGRPGEARVSWSPPVNDGGSPITRYEVTAYVCNGPTTGTGDTEARRCRRPGGTASQAANVAFSVNQTVGPVTFLDVGGLQNGTYYNFKVATENETTRDAGGATTFGTKSLFANPAVTPKAVPLPPTGVTGRDPGFASGTFAEVWWTPAVQPAGVAAPTSYVIEVDCTCTADGRTYTTTNLNPTSAAPVIIGANTGQPNALPPGVALQFLVRGVNAVGTSVSSEPSPPLTLLGVPGTPQNVQATSTGGNGEVLVSWLAPASDGGSPITGYKISYCQGVGCNPATGTVVSTGSPALAFTVQGLTNGQTYRFAVRATNARGDSAVLSSAVTAVPSTNTAAPIIGIAEGTGTSGQAKARWSPPVDTGGSPITGYVVTASSGEEVLAGPADTEATFDGLADGVAVTFTVVAVNANGESPASNASNPVVPGTRPGSPAPVTAFPTNGRGQLQVSWSEASANGAAVIRYVVTARCSCASDGVQVSVDAPATETVLTGLVDGATHTVEVHAVNVWGDGPTATSEAAVPVGPADAPTAVSATATGQPGTVNLTWTAPVDTHGSPVLEYRITSSSGQVFDPVTTTSATVTGLPNGTPVTFTVVAVSAAGSSDPSAPSNTVSPFSVPGQPLDLVATATGTAGEVSLTWTAPADNGRPILDYRVITSGGDELTVPPGSSTTLTGLDESTAVSFVIIARNAAGDGPASGSSNTVTPAGRPDAPSGYDVITTGIGGEVKVSFNPSITHGVPVDRYTATIACGAGCSLDGTSRTIVSGDVIGGLGNGTTVTVSVVAESAVGNSSAVADTVTTPLPASAPTFAGAGYTGLKGQAVIYWQDAPDGGSPITGYQIRAIGPDITLPAVASPCPANVYTGTSMTVTAVPAGRTCVTTSREALPDNTAVTFRVRAVTGVSHPDDGNPATFDPSEGWSNSTIGFTTPSVPGGIPASMTAVATGTSDEIRVTWAAPTSNGRSPLIDYQIEVLRGATIVRTVSPAPPVGTTTWLITALPDLPVGQTYSVRVRARNDVGLGGARTVTGVTPTP